MFGCQQFVLLLCVFASVVHSHRFIPYDSQQFFELINKVTITDLKYSGSAQQEASYTFKALLKFNSVWNANNHQILEVFFEKSSVSAPAKSSNKQIVHEITKIPDRPFYILIVDGRAKNVIAHTSRDQSLLNLERGIASLLQLPVENVQKGHANEQDVSGDCSVFYAQSSTMQVEKTKTDCTHWDLRVRTRTEKPLSVSKYSRANVHFSLSAEGALLKAESTETHRLALEANTDVGSLVDSYLLLKHTEVGDVKGMTPLKYDSSEEAINSLLEWYRVFELQGDVDGALSEIKGGAALSDKIKIYAKQLTNEDVGSAELARIFAELVPIARITERTELVKILKKYNEQRAQLVDLLATVQTMDTYHAIFEVLDFNTDSDLDLIEKYLQSLAVAAHPEPAILTELFKRLQNSSAPLKSGNVRDSLMQTVAALTRQSGFEPSHEIQTEIRTFILEELNSNCNEAMEVTACKTRAIRALQNLQDPTTIPILITNALEGEIPLSVTSMQALKSFPIVHYHEAQRNSFAQLFYQCKRKYDSSARTLALDILLSMKPSKDQLGHLLDYLTSNDRQFEIKTYVIQKLNMLAEKCPRFNALLRDCLAERPAVNNYDVIAQKGLTTVLSRDLSQAPAFNESLLSIQEIYQGVLKRGSVELILNAGRDEISTFKIGMYTSGLSSFVGDDDSDSDEDFPDDATDDDDSPATAGMEISTQGVLLRPLVFFTGKSELMGHVWSGTASEPTPAFQATMVAQDHEEYIVLSSGATVYMRVIGAKSVDLNGKVELSLWNRNANTEIQQNAGDAIVGLVVAGLTYAKVENEFTLSHEPQIKLQADIDFYSGIKLCMQLQRPETVLTHTKRKSVFLNTAKPYTKHIRSKFTHKLVGRTLALNQKNNEMCNMIFN